jgi:hypothetical protein
MARRVGILVALCGLSLPLSAQLTAEQTGVPTEALQHSFDDYTSFSASHGQLCQKALKQTLPGIRGLPQELTADLNVAGVLTSRWKQEVAVLMARNRSCGALNAYRNFVPDEN